MIPRSHEITIFSTTILKNLLKFCFKHCQTSFKRCVLRKETIMQMFHLVMIPLRPRAVGAPAPFWGAPPRAPPWDPARPAGGPWPRRRARPEPGAARQTCSDDRNVHAYLLPEKIPGILMFRSQQIATRFLTVSTSPQPHARSRRHPRPERRAPFPFALDATSNARFENRSA